jgi:hypothetical protein
MGYRAAIRAMEAAQRRQEREAQKRQRELERQNKEQAKLSTIEQARLEVEIYENKLDVLLSVHRQQGEVWDWLAVASSLPPPLPRRNANQEFKTKQLMLVATSQEKERANAAIEEARAQDERAFKWAMDNYKLETSEHERMKGLAFRILHGQHKAYIEALIELSPLREITDLGSELQFVVHSTRLMECEIKVKSIRIIPAEVKSLTAGGKLSVKSMPKVRFQEIYQNYICGCMLRVAREVFAMLPVEALLITALSEMQNGSGERPVLSAVLPRVDTTRLDFERIDSSEALETFRYRGDLEISRKASGFQAIIPFTPADISPVTIEALGLSDLLVNIQTMRAEIKSEITELTDGTDNLIPQNPPIT